MRIRSLSTGSALLVLKAMTGCSGTAGPAPTSHSVVKSSQMASAESSTSSMSASDDTRTPTAHFLPTIVQPEMFQDYPQALADGELSASNIDGVVYFVLGSGEIAFGLVLPPGYHALPGNPIALADADGQLVATVGDTVSFGGGEYPDGRALWEGGPPIASPWIVAP